MSAMEADFHEELQIVHMKRMNTLCDEIMRMSHLDNKTLAEEIVAMARGIRASGEHYGHPQDEDAHINNPEYPGYENSLVWHIIPEIARRLGGLALLDNEATASYVRSASNEELRDIANIALLNSMMGHRAETQAWASMMSEVSFEEIIDANPGVFGNPVAFAINRLAPMTLMEAVSGDGDYLSGIHACYAATNDLMN